MLLVKDFIVSHSTASCTIIFCPKRSSQIIEIPARQQKYSHTRSSARTQCFFQTRWRKMKLKNVARETNNGDKQNFKKQTFFFSTFPCSAFSEQGGWILGRWPDKNFKCLPSLFEVLLFFLVGNFLSIVNFSFLILKLKFKGCLVSPSHVLDALPQYSLVLLCLDF